MGIGGDILYELNRDVKLDGSLKYNIISAYEALEYFSLSVGFVVGINWFIITILFSKKIYFLMRVDLFFEPFIINTII